MLVTNAQATPHMTFNFMGCGSVYANSLNIFPFNQFCDFEVLQSRVHEVWSRFLCSSMKDDLRYNPSDCLETFPFPNGWETNATLEASGQEYYEYRTQLMRDSNRGLTKTYNRFHDPKERSPEIRLLRELHTAMDRAVLAAYGWTDIDTTCGFDFDWCESEAADDASPDTLERLDSGRYFFESAEEARAFATELAGGGTKLPWRYRWRPEVRDEVIARLLVLNKERAEAERLAGLSPLADVATDDDDGLDEDDDDGASEDDD